MYNLCRDCFQIGYDDTAKNRFLLLSADEKECQFCRRQKRVVVEFFKYGEMESTDDSTVVKGRARHLGLNPNYSYWSNECPFGNSETAVTPAT